MTQFIVHGGDSTLRANARSTVHAFSYRAPISGEINTTVVNSSFDLTDPITSALVVDLEQLTSDDRLVDGEMHRRLDTQRFPLARATVDEVRSIGVNTYRLSGTLALRGQDRAISGDAMVVMDGEVLHAVGSITLDLREFGVKLPSLPLLKVYPEVEILIDLKARVATS